MQISDQENKNQNNKKKIKKSQLCLFGSLLVIVGITVLSMEHIKELKKQVFSDMQLSFMNEDNTNDIIQDVPKVEEVKEEPLKKEEENNNKTIDYSKYTGIIEIPKIRLKRGFYNIGHKYNDIEHNVTVLSGSTMPDVVNGNLILAAHSGDAYISYFAYLYKLVIGDYVYITYNGITYKYQIVNIYNVPKTGSVTINRNEAITTLTLITCTKNSDTEQTVYIAELV